MDKDRLHRIRLLSSRFHELHGLRIALAGIVYAIVFGSYLIAATPTETGVLVAGLVAVAISLPAERWLTHYYATTFGRQVSASKEHRIVLVFFVIGMLTAPLEPLQAATVIVGGFSLWVAVRDWRWRAYYLVPAGAVAFSYAAHHLGGSAIDSGVRLAETMLLIGVSFVPVGFLDHRLLVRLTAESRTRTPEPAEPRNLRNPVQT